MFRNLRFYHISNPWPESEQELSDLLLEKAFTPCGAFSERSAGWEAPAAMDDAPLCRRLHGADLIQLRTQSRVLPAAAVKEAMEERVTEYQVRMEQDPPRAEMRRLKEETRDQLLPKALVKSERTRACFIHSESVLAVDAGTISKAEWFIEHLRFCFPQFRCTPLTFNKSPTELLNRIFLEKPPSGFALGRECRMQDVMDSKSIATWRDCDLADESIRHHVIEGMRLTHLGISFDEIMTCVLSEEGDVSKLKFFQGETVDRTDEEEPLARLDTDFVLLTGMVKRFIEELRKLLGGFANQT
jgi:recombination associated protein RdgC